MVVQRNGKPKILAAECDKICPAGKSGCCCRVMVVIWKLDEIFRNKKVQPTDNRGCICKPRKWGIPRKRTVQHKPVMTEKLFNPHHSSGIQGKKRRGAYPTLFDPRQSKSRKWELESVERLKENIQKVNPAVPFPKMILEADSIKVLGAIVREVAYGSDTNLIVCGKLKLYTYISHLWAWGELSHIWRIYQISYRRPRKAL